MLNKAFNIVNCLNLGQSVLLTETSETNNLIFTPIITSLVQIIIEERCRTIDGICDIVDREWMLGGHDFISRKAYPSFGWIVFIEGMSSIVFAKNVARWRYLIGYAASQSVSEHQNFNF